MSVTLLAGPAFTTTLPVMPAPALMFTVVSALDVVLSAPPEGLAASQSTLPVLTPEQTACASDAQAIATDLQWVTAADIEPRSRRDPSRWGGWRLGRGRRVLSYRPWADRAYLYQVDLDDMTSSAKVLLGHADR